jgi:hypothetical protein
MSKRAMDIDEKKEIAQNIPNQIASSRRIGVRSKEERKRGDK